MLNCQKDKFNIPEDIRYINVAYMSPNLKSVEEAGIQGVLKKSHPWTVSREDFFKPVTELKSTFARLINSGEPERIALIPSVSYGMANVVKNIHGDKKNNIVLADEGFPSNYYSWKRLSDEKGITLNIVSPPKETTPRAADWNQKILESINENTLAVSVGNIHWADGTLFDLEKIRAKATAHDALLIIDGTQSVGAYPFDLEKVKPDALICASYKWLLGSYTFGVAYFGEKFDNGIPIEENWINRLGSHQFENLVNYQPLYKPLANRYMMGEQSNFIGVLMLQAALNQILDWGVQNIQTYLDNLTRQPIAAMTELGCQFEEGAYRSPHMFGVRLSEKMDMKKLLHNFSQKNIYVSRRGNAIRVAPHLYNTKEDFEALVECFQNAIMHKTCSY